MSDSAFQTFFRWGPNADRLAFTPDPPSAIPVLYVWHEDDTGDVYHYVDGAWVLITSSGSTGDVSGPGGSVTDKAAVRWNGTSGTDVEQPPVAPLFEDDGRISNVTDPSGAQDAATKAYVDGIAVNLGKRARVRAATTANITIATALNNGDALDGVTLATGDLVLVKNQTAPEENGIYTVGVSPARAPEFDTYNEHPGTLLAVEEGSTNADTLWLCTSNDGGTLNTTAIAFSQLNVSAGAPTAGSYVTIASEAGLSAERTLTGTANQVVVTDGGANSPVTLSTPQNTHTAATPQFARLGLGAAADGTAELKGASSRLRIAGQYRGIENAAGNSGTALTIDWDAGMMQTVTMTGNCTFTFSNPQTNGRYILVLTQDGSGGRTAVWPAAVKWPGGTPPMLSPAAAAVDAITFAYDGTRYLAQASLDFS